MSELFNIVTTELIEIATPQLQVVEIGIQGVAGRDGSNGILGNFVANQDIVQGMPVYISRANGQIGIANAASYTQSLIAGFTVSAVNSGFTVDIKSGVSTLSDWTAIAGTATLQKGQLYFLSLNGGITTTPDRTTAQAIVSIGEALSATTLFFNPSNPILL
jgi:hypothetical protein